MPSDVRAALRALVDDYARLADDRDGVGFSALWLPGATLSIFDGAPAPRRTYADTEMHQVIDRLAQHACTMHMVSNHHVELTDEGALGEAYCEAHHVARGEHPERPDVVLTIRYRDAYGRDEHGSWRFAKRECHIQWRRNDTVFVGPPS